ncbi:MAG: hypothetical protein Edafosvirus2_15 [Edafosvirus sp.]|uniref:Uncharacterized protein n=1 Tax=Edafosvirus sp. TaxID=2487765 RepID=A0A3G4ZSG4_9VIRU|nr:MAG: hypothetical protein Edafosvirus2_15 [Edafosvirus sp.]
MSNAKKRKCNNDMTKKKNNKKSKTEEKQSNIIKCWIPKCSEKINSLDCVSHNGACRKDICSKHTYTCDDCKHISCDQCYYKTWCLCGFHKCKNKQTILKRCPECYKNKHKITRVWHRNGTDKNQCRPFRNDLCCDCKSKLANDIITDITNSEHLQEHKPCVCGDSPCKNDFNINNNHCDFAWLLHPNNNKRFHKLINYKMNEYYIEICCECAEVQKNIELMEIIKIPKVLYSIITDYSMNDFDSKKEKLKNITDYFNNMNDLKKGKIELNSVNEYYYNNYKNTD